MPRGPESTREEAPLGRPAVTWPEQPRNKHSGQRELQSQRACHGPLPAKTQSHLPKVHLQEARVGRAGTRRWGGIL